MGSMSSPRHRRRRRRRLRQRSAEPLDQAGLSAPASGLRRLPPPHHMKGFPCMHQGRQLARGHKGPILRCKRWARRTAAAPRLSSAPAGCFSQLLHPCCCLPFSQPLNAHAHPSEPPSRGSRTRQGSCPPQHRLPSPSAGPRCACGVCVLHSGRSCGSCWGRWWAAAQVSEGTLPAPHAPTAHARGVGRRQQQAGQRRPRAAPGRSSAPGRCTQSLSSAHPRSVPFHSSNFPSFTCPNHRRHLDKTRSGRK